MASAGGAVEWNQGGASLGHQVALANPVRGTAMMGTSFVERIVVECADTYPYPVRKSGLLW